MSTLLKVADSFVNIRGSFKIGPLDIGTHCSLVKKQNGKWLMLDCTKLEPDVKLQVDDLTNGGKDIESIVNLHPFHTVACKWAHETFPGAKLYGASRHVEKVPDLPWQKAILDDPATCEEFKEDLDLRIPAGVDFISDNESVHFSSVVAYHRATKTIHVDDTFTFIPLPSAVLFAKEGTVQLHPTLAAALQPRQGAATDFEDWMDGVFTDWADAKNLCAAHTGALLDVNNTGDSILSRLQFALTVGKPTLLLHSVRYGK